MSISTTLTVRDVQIDSLVGPSIAFVVTAIRIYDRVSRSQFWWDDAFAIVAMVGIITVVAGFWARSAPDYATSYSLRIGSYYMCAHGFYTAIWAARYSILFTIIRIAPTILYKRCLYGVATAFALIYAILFAQVFWRCVPDPEQWQQETENVACPLGTNVAVAQLITDILSDLTLIAIPIWLFWNLTFNRNRRMRLQSVFIASLSTTIVSLVHAAYILINDSVGEFFTAMIELSVSAIVCNLAVIVAIAYRFQKRPEADMEDDMPTKPSQSTLDFNRAVRLRRFGGTTQVVQEDTKFDPPAHELDSASDVFAPQQGGTWKPSRSGSQSHITTTIFVREEVEVEDGDEHSA